MPWTDLEFMRSYFGAFKQYYFHRESTWNKYDPYGDERPFLDAVHLYVSMVNPPSSELVLGDTKVRTDSDLLSKYGMVVSRGVDQAERKKIIDDAARTGIELRWKELVTKIGAILSSENWNSALNDTFILAGVHSGARFIFEERLAGPANVAGRQLARVGGGPVSHSEQWRSFFNHNPKILWDPDINKPRILLREFLGLNQFGYKPELTENSLTLLPGDAKLRDKSVATFENYTKCLTDSGYTDSKKDKVLPVVAQFLFNDEHALTLGLFGDEGREYANNQSRENTMTLLNAQGRPVFI